MISDDVWSGIIQFLDASTICSLIQTSTTHRDLLQKEYLWNILIQRDFEHKLKDEYLYSESLTSIELYKHLFVTCNCFPHVFLSSIQLPTMPENYTQLNGLIVSNLTHVSTVLWYIFSSGVWNDSNKISFSDTNGRTLFMFPKNKSNHSVYKILWRLTDVCNTVKHSSFRYPHMILTGYDIADPVNTLSTVDRSNSLSNALFWIEYASKYRIDSVPIYLIGVRLSCNEITAHNSVTKREIIQYCKDHNINYFEVRRETYKCDVAIVLNHFIRYHSQIHTITDKKHEVIPRQDKSCIIC
jgi:hypothetical protein